MKGLLRLCALSLSSDRGAVTVKPKGSWLWSTALPFATPSKAPTVGFRTSPATGTVVITETGEIVTPREAPSWLTRDETLIISSRVESFTSRLELNSRSVTEKFSSLELYIASTNAGKYPVTQL